MEDTKDEHKCNTCNKIFSSYKTLWTHNKNKHKNNNIKKYQKDIIEYQNNDDENKIFVCKYCNKEFSFNNNRYRHEQKCKIIFEEKQNNEIKLAEINKEKEIKLAEINEKIELAKINSNKEIELKKLEIKKENTIIKRKANTNPTIKNINKLLQNKINMTNSNLTSNSHNTNNIQNIVHNHFKIEGFGKENILDVITDKEKKLILNQGCESIEKLIEIVYVGKYDQFKNILITNKRDNDIYMYDDKSGLYINNDKNLVLNKLVANRLGDVEEIYNAGHVRFCLQNHSVLDEFDENNSISDAYIRPLGL